MNRLAPIFMLKRTHSLSPWRLLAVVFIVVLSNLCVSGKLSAQTAQWIWSPDHTPGDVPQAECHFRKTFSGTNATRARVLILADDEFELYVNGRQMATGSGWRKPQEINISSMVRPGPNVLAVKVANSRGSSAGLAAKILIDRTDDKTYAYATDASWRTTLNPLALWYLPRYSDRRWSAAQELGADGETAPWIVAAAEPTPEETADNTSNTASEAPVTSTPIAPIDGAPLFRALPDFEVQVLGGQKEVGSLIAMAFNEFGELLLSQEGGPLLMMSDTNRDNLPDTVRTVCDEVKNVQGILALNGDVYVTGDGPDGAGLFRLADQNGDGRLEIVNVLIEFEGTMTEHGPHGIALGPDGFIYLMLGNHTKVKTEISPDSPYRNAYEGDILPRFEDPGGHAVGIKAPGGTVLRASLDGEKVECVAGGLRNAYDLAFDRAGNLFTHDSDMETDEGSPWFRATRVSLVTPGSEHGWRSGWANWPTYLYDGAPPLIETDRGSPTGVVCYDHFMYPEKYQGSMFVCDWTNGRLLHIPMQRSGAAFKASSEVFLEGEPLNVTDVDVGPDGWVYFTTGGRQTAGGIYRVIYKGTTPNPVKRIGTGVPAAIRQPQFQAPWARQAIAKVKLEAGDKWDSTLPAVVRTEKNSVRFRTRALDLMHLYGPGPATEMLVTLSEDKEPEVREKAADLLGLSTDSEAATCLAKMLGDEDAGVRRHASEALLRSGGTATLEQLKPLLVSRDRYEAAAGRRLLERLPLEKWQEKILTTKDHRLFIQGGTALMIAQPDAATAQKVITRFRQHLSGFVADDDFLDMLRMVEITVERGGIAAEDATELRDALADEFPANHVLMNRELVRLLVYLKETRITDRYLEYLGTDLKDADRVQIALHLALLEEGWTEGERMKLLAALEKATTVKTGQGIGGYVRNVSKQFAATLTEDDQREILTNAANMPNAALAVLYQLPEESSDEINAALRTAYVKLEGSTTEASEQLQNGIIAVLGTSADDDSMKFLRERYLNDPERRLFLGVALAQKPAGENWPMVVDSLQIVEGPFVKAVLTALTNVDLAPEEAEPYRQVILRGLELGDDGAEAVALLEHWTGESQNAAADDVPAQLAAWQKWFATRWPNHPEAVLPVETNDNAWKYDELLAHVTSHKATEKGSAQRGALVFEKAQCAKCHRFGTKGESMGPDLTTLSKRFRKKEMLDSIYYPSHVISDQYRSQTIITDDGRSITGILAAGSPGELVVLQSTGQKVRVREASIEETVPSKVSSMPAGLLNNLTLDEITDLFAFLSSRPEASTAARPRTPR